MILLNAGTFQSAPYAIIVPRDVWKVLIVMAGIG